MKKRVVTIVLVIILMFIIGTVHSLATSNVNIEMNVEGQTTINTTNNTVELILSLGDFTGIEEKQPLGYQGMITYNDNIIEGITVEGLNGWTANYEESTKVLMGEIDSSTANTQIAKIILTLKEGLTAETTGTVEFKDILLTDGTNDFSFNKEIVITIKEEENNEKNEVNDNTINGETTNTSNTSIKANNTDTTVAKKVLPSAGTKNIIIIGIVGIILLAVIFKIKARKIKY